LGKCRRKTISIAIVKNDTGTQTIEIKLICRVEIGNMNIEIFDRLDLNKDIVQKKCDCLLGKNALENVEEDKPYFPQKFRPRLSGEWS